MTLAAIFDDAFLLSHCCSFISSLAVVVVANVFVIVFVAVAVIVVADDDVDDDFKDEVVSEVVVVVVFVTVGVFVAVVDNNKSSMYTNSFGVHGYRAGATLMRFGNKLSNVSLASTIGSFSLIELGGGDNSIGLRHLGQLLKLSKHNLHIWCPFGHL